MIWIHATAALLKDVEWEGDLPTLLACMGHGLTWPMMFIDELRK